MKIQKLVIQNLRSVGAVPVTIEWNNTPLTLISASNGVGKSTILYALAFVLFGVNMQTKGSTKTLITSSLLINDINKKDLIVECVVEDYTIRRGLKPNIFEILDKDGNNIANSSSKVIDQNWLEENILKMNYTMYARTTSLNAKLTTVPFAYMTPQERKKHVEDLLGVDIFRKLEDNIRTKNSLLNIEAKGYADNSMEINTKINMISGFIETLSSGLGQKVDNSQKIKVLEDDLTKKKTEFTELKKQYDPDAMNRLNSKITEQQSDIRSLESLNQKIELELQSIKTKSKSIKDLKLSYDTAVDKAKNNDAPCDTDIRLSCPLVLSMIPKYDFDESITEMTILKNRFKELTNEKAEIPSKIDEANKLITSTQQELKSIEQIKHKLDNITIEAKSITQQLSILKSEASNVDEANNTKKLKIDEYKQQSSTLNSDLAKSDKSLDEINNQIAVLQSVKSKVLDKTIKEEIFGYYVPYFTSCVNDLIGKFFEYDRISLRIELSPLFEITVYKDGSKTNLLTLSDGQLSSLNFAFTFGFMLLMQEYYGEANLNILFIDEILDIALDQNRINAVVDYLKELSNDRDITIISHSDKIDVEVFDRVLEPYKDDMGFTHIRVKN